jgi:hypothetical protein
MRLISYVVNVFGGGGGVVLRIFGTSGKRDEEDRYITEFHTYHLVSHLTMITGERDDPPDVCVCVCE